MPAVIERRERLAAVTRRSRHIHDICMSVAHVTYHNSFVDSRTDTHRQTNVHPQNTESQRRIAPITTKRYASSVSATSGVRKRIQPTMLGERNLFAKYVTKQKINNKNSTMEGYQKRR